jgi:polyribonucleotide nucleotidyltransferase
VGTVTIGAKDGNAVEEARRRISLILDPPTAEVGAVYDGKVVNLTKFGAFVNVLPGRDGLLHISKLSPLAGGKRVGAVEDVLTLGQPLQVRVDDIDPQGKVSLTLAGAPETAAVAGDDGESHARPDGDRGERGGPARVSFEDSFEAELVADLGDLGPGAAPSRDDGRGGQDDRRRSRSRQRRR